LGKLAPIAEELKAIRKKYAAFDQADPRVDPNVLQYKIPGGMISNFISQLEQSNALSRLNEVLAEVPRVREDMGYPPLVTPSSQIVGSQAVLNVLQGERYKMATKETQNYFKGEYGASPAPMNQDYYSQLMLFALYVNEHRRYYSNLLKRRG
jgi:oxaloacetate decarboxylase alpha subunit